jgi:hypothetical protein
MGMDRTLLLKKEENGNDRYIHDVFVASFDMLWSPPESEDINQTPIERITEYGKAPHSWLRTTFAMLWLKCRLRPRIKVKDHEYTLQMLNNPGFEALIEYKWYAIFAICFLSPTRVATRKVNHLTHSPTL